MKQKIEMNGLLKWPQKDKPTYTSNLTVNFSLKKMETTIGTKTLVKKAYILAMISNVFGNIS